MKPSILAIGKSLPSYSFSQMEIANRMNDLLDLQEKDFLYLKKIYTNSAIDKRYSVLPDLIHTKKGKEAIGMSHRNSLYKKEALPLAKNAASTALKNWKGDLSEITHLISVSCTGAITPGIEFYVAKELNLSKEISLLGINFLGCYGAFKALKVAKKIAEDAKNRVLLVCTELCTLHFKPSPDIESMVIQSLFADGSAAVIVGKDSRKGETPIFEIVDEQSYIMDDSAEKMTWEASDEGFSMTLSPTVPKIIRKYIEPFVNKLLQNQGNQHDYEWAVHPGGRAIIEAVEHALKLVPFQSVSSWNVLKHYGNLSSASFLYVLEDIIHRKQSKKEVVGLGFGPGLSVEGILLRQLRDN